MQEARIPLRRDKSSISCRSVANSPHPLFRFLTCVCWGRGGVVLDPFVVFNFVNLKPNEKLPHPSCCKIQDETHRFWIETTPLTWSYPTQSVRNMILNKLRLIKTFVTPMGEFVIHANTRYSYVNKPTMYDCILKRLASVSLLRLSS